MFQSFGFMLKIWFVTINSFLKRISYFLNENLNSHLITGLQKQGP